MGAHGYSDERDCPIDLQPVECPSPTPVLLTLNFLFRNDFVEIMEMLDKRLNDKGKNWRHVFKVSINLVL